jgi:hypothetical protein
MPAQEPTLATFPPPAGRHPDSWQILASVLRTATQQACDPVELLTCLLRAPTPIVADHLAIPGR